MREHLEVVFNNTGIKPKALEQPELPESVAYLWEWFCRLSARRQIGMGPCPISWAQIDAFFRLIGVKPDEWELAAIELLDNCWLDSANKG